MLITEEELRSLLNKAGLNVFSYERYSYISCVYLTASDINVLIDYAKVNQIKNILYCYKYLDEDEYKFDEYVSLLSPTVDPLMHPEDYEKSSKDYIEDIIRLAKNDISNY